MYRNFPKSLGWLSCLFVFALVAACGNELEVNEYQFTCDPGVPDQCGDGYVCRAVPGEAFSACYELDSEPGDVGADADAGPTDASDATDTPDAPDASASDGGDTTGDVSEVEDTDTSDGGDADVVNCGTDQELCGGDCVDLNTSTDHCSECDLACTETDENAIPQCNQGACGLTCETGFFDTNNDLGQPGGDGCECEQTTTDEQSTDESHCDGLDNDCDGTIDEGCACDYNGIDVGVCKNGTITESGDCQPPSTYQAVEFGCGTDANGQPRNDSLDNDCDGHVDEIDAQAITTGGAHACALHGDRIFCWGRQWTISGTGNTTSRETPYEVAHPMSGGKFEQLSAGSGHTCAIDQNKNAFCWGLGSNYRLGNNSNHSPRLNPVPVGGTNPPSFKAISAGGSHSCGVTTTGKVLCWGKNDLGQGGSDTNGADIQTPTEVDFGGSEPAFETVAAGLDFTCAKGENGELYCWGSNDHGKLGVGSDPSSLSSTHTPQMVYTQGVKTIDLGYEHACVALNNQEGYCWGDDADERLGNGNGGFSNTPDQVVGNVSFLGIRAGAFNTCGIDDNSREGFCWGRASGGVIGDGQTSTQPKAQPTLVTDVSAFHRIDVGTNFACGIGADDNVYCWGNDHEGKLGNGTSQGDANAPSVVGCF